MNVLMVLTSHDTLGNTGLATGFWLEEFASPYYVFKDKGFDITIASPKGGLPPMDPKSDAPESHTTATERFRGDKQAQDMLANTRTLESVNTSDFDAVFYPGGHGPLWDLAEDTLSISLIAKFYGEGKPVGFVCHAPGVLRHVKDRDGKHIVNGKKVTGFTNTEEEAVQLTDVVPFLVEDMLTSNGGLYDKGADWSCYVEVDGNLITGQNPASSTAAAEAIVKMLDE